MIRIMDQNHNIYCYKFSKSLTKQIKHANLSYMLQIYYQINNFFDALNMGPANGII